MNFTRIVRLARLSVMLVLFIQVRAATKVVAYVPNWINVSVFSESIDYGKLTHINVAFENPINSEGDISFRSQDSLLIAKAKENGVKILVSIGGGSAAENPAMKSRYFDLLTAGKRQAFVTKLADYVSEHDFDGLDVDIEGPTINQDYGAFIQALAQKLKPRGKLLTAALSKGYGGDRVPVSVFEHFDFINIMAYDATGPWSPKAPGQHSSIEYARTNVSYWLDRGLPKSKAVLGVPFYGYGFGAAFRQRDYPYSAILAAHPGAEKLDQVGETIWYNGMPTIQAKAQYVLEQELAGLMIWSLDADVKDQRSLLTAIHETLRRDSGKSSIGEKPGLGKPEDDEFVATFRVQNMPLSKAFEIYQTMAKTTLIHRQTSVPLKAQFSLVVEGRTDRRALLTLFRQALKEQLGILIEPLDEKHSAVRYDPTFRK